MARSPLMNRLQSLAREVAVARRLGMAPGELREWRESATRRSSRRDLLRGAAALGVTAALPARLFARQLAPRIAIVGGGMAGLSAALALRDKGVDAAIYEAQPRIGGRVFSRTDDYFGGQTVEWCGELIDTGHKRMRALAKRFHLDLVNVKKAAPKGSTDTYHVLGSYVTEEQVLAAFEAMAAVLDQDLEAAGYPTTFLSSTSAGQALDMMSVYDYIESRVPGGHAAPLGALLDIAYNTEYSAETTDQSALNLIYLLGFQPKQAAFEWFGESDEVSRIDGGNEQLPRAMAELLGAGCVHTEHALIAMTRQVDGTVRLTFDTPAGTIEVVADVVLLTLPFTILRQLDLSGMDFTPLKQQAIDELGAGHAGKLQLQFTDRLWNAKGQPWGARSNGGTYADLGYQSSWEATRGQPGTAGILNLFSGGAVTDAMTTTAPFADAFTPSVVTDAGVHLGGLEGVFPGVTALWNGKATCSLPHLSPYFGLSYAYYRVGQYTAFGGIEGADQGNVFFAGEHTSQDFQGFMEGAAREGMQAAKRIRKYLKAVV